MKLKTFKFKLEPNKGQRVFLNKNLGCCRFLYNQMLEEREDRYKHNNKSKLKTEKQYKEEFEFLKEADSVSLQQIRIDLKNAYNNHFRKIKQKQKTSLRFKSKHNSKHSYRTINNNSNIKVRDNYIKVPKLGFVKFAKSREIIGRIKSITISRDVLNNYYISVLCETEIQELPKLDTQIGIDLGIKEFCITSNNEFVSNPKYLRKSEVKLKKIQRIFSNRVKGSIRKSKQQKKLFKTHEKIRNQRLDFLHKLSTKLISENQVICLEDLQVKNMVKNHCLAKSISDCSWSKFVELLKYKADWYGRELVKIDKFFPSSKICNHCGNIKKDLTLKDREYHCSLCRTTIDRDYNASLNILKEGLRILKKNCWVDRDSSVNIQTLVCSS